jgi:polysaccharide biosynthesis/export protein
MGRPRAAYIFALFLLFGCLGCAGRGAYVDAARYATAHPPQPADWDKIRPGDVISVQVFEDQKLSDSQAVVRPSGRISLPLAGEFQAAGKTTTELARLVETEIGVFIKTPHVTVTFIKTPVIVDVIGEVSAPGRKEFPGPTLIAQVLVAAGGLGEYADPTAIYLLRGADRIRFDYQDLLRGAPHTRSFWVQSGDLLVVE